MLKAMEELAKPEEKRGNPGYLPEDGVLRVNIQKATAETGHGGV